MAVARLAVALAVIGVLASCADAEDQHDPDCIMAVQVDYRSGLAVETEAHVRRAFEAFVAFSQERAEPIFGDSYGNDWRFDGASVDTTFEDVLYWEVRASWRSSDDGRWRSKHVFHVSEQGDVVRLLACV